ncbi:MAG: hypothetical protein D6719_02470 [Candidatus Dadabacteria bacterium]|nr:MAG: hypothetical protein D6719_02470 [Candidatus Dadabacteria bacterium]
MKSLWLKAFIILILILLSILAYYHTTPLPRCNDSNPEEFKSCVSDRINYASEYFKNLKPPVSVDVIWLLGEIERRIGKIDNPALNKYFSTEYNRENPFRRFLNIKNPLKGFEIKRAAASPFEIEEAGAFWPEKWLYTVNEDLRGYLKHPWDDVLLKALYCDISGYDKKDLEFLLHRARYDGSYADTHVLLGLLIVKKLGCLPYEQIKTVIKKLTDSIAGALEIDHHFRDLYAERVLLLYWSPLENDSINKEWIKLLLKKQNRDGGWGYPRSSPHTSAISLLVLYYWHNDIQPGVENIPFN